MPPQETSTASASPPVNPAAAGAPPGGAASGPVSRTRKGTAARGMSVAPLALAVLAQVGVIGQGGGTGAGAPASTQPAKCGTGISDYQACHDGYPTGCSGAGGYDGYLNSLKNELVDPAGEPQQAFGVPSLEALEKDLPADLTKTNHEALEAQMIRLGEGEVASLSGYLYYAKDGGAESSNCLLKGADNIDFHIGISADAVVAAKAKAKNPGLSPADRSQAVIVEMTPHWRAKYEPGWNLALVQKAVGRQVYVVGQLLADNEHDDAKDDCAYTGAGGAGPNCWRGTVWELHPVTRFLVCAAAQCDEKGTGAGWTPLESFDPAKADGAAATKAPSPASPGAKAAAR